MLYQIHVNNIMVLSYLLYADSTEEISGSESGVV